MKPDEEMHADVVEEVELDPRDLYTDLGTLIIEGRIPGLTERGYGEGPHCMPVQGQNRHQCDPTSPECQQYDVILKHMLLLWKNGIPMSIEVLLYPECCASSTRNQTIDASSVPDMSYLLLEQWTVHMLPRRVMDAAINCRGLIQAVRSFLHFSQLSAWLSLTGGQSPQNIHYRICVPGEAFSSKFTTNPNMHIFPIANIGRTSAMKIAVKSHPRCGKIPTVVCHKHDVCQAVAPIKPLLSKCQPTKPIPDEKTTTANISEDEYCPEDGIITEQFSSSPLSSSFLSSLKITPQKSARNNSPGDSMLGDSLLDPPNSLQMYPKRYQSPSRCGSPSQEVPEHLMFGKAASVRREAERNRVHLHGRERSRPQRRPVVERFLKKNFSEATKVTENSIGKHPHHQFEPSKGLHNKFGMEQENVQVCSYMCDVTDSNIPREEMEHVLSRLRQRCPVRKHPTANTSKLPFQKGENKSPMLKKLQYDIGESSNSNQKHLSAQERHLLHQRTLCPFPLLGESKNANKCIDNRLSQLTNAMPQTELGNIYQQSEENAKIILDHLHSVPSAKDVTAKKLIGDEFTTSNDFKHKCIASNVDNSKNSLDFNSEKTNGNSFLALSTSTYPGAVREKSVNGNCVDNSLQECIQTLPENKASTESFTNNNRTALNIEQRSSLAQNLLTAATILKEHEADRKGYLVPSADQKAQFRRSLDSATCMVFHQKTGLPLTSSPAPVRKSGTCFDFDSSLTSVSAIKRALFEKDPEAEIDNKYFLSTSAPASITTSNLLGNFEESVLNGRLEPVSTVEGFTAELGASGSFCPRHITLPVTVFFYTLQDIDKMASPYLGHINLGKKGYHVPRKGTVQLTLFNPHQTVVKMFVVRYDICDMPVNCQTFVRQRTLYMPVDASDEDPDASKWLRYLIHLRFSSSRSGRIYLHTDIRMIIFRKSDLDAATVHSQRPYELRSFTQCPINPKFSPLK